MTKRTDLAAPSVIDPAAFVFVAGVYFGCNQNEEFDEMLGEWMGEKVDGGDPSWFSKRDEVRTQFPALVANSNFVRKGTCDHCGARFDWGSVYKHTSGGHIVVGNVCADKTLSVPSRLALDEKRMKARIAAAREAARNAAKARAEAIEGGYEWLYDGKHNNRTLDDIAAKGLAWGGLTGAQVALVKRIHSGTLPEWQVLRAKREAEQAAEDATAQPVPVSAERMEVEGEIVSTKEQDGFNPGEKVLKMLVKTTHGFKLWGTVPANLRDEFGGTCEAGPFLRGKRVAFAAKLERSRDDAKFGFFSRPTKARIVTAAV